MNKSMVSATPINGFNANKLGDLMEELKNLNLKVRGMHCQSCARLIAETLKDLDGVREVKASFEDENVKVKYDARTLTQRVLEEKLDELGYPAEGSQSSNSGKKKKRNLTLKQGIVYGLTPHIGCIGFIAASILGVTVAVEFFKPLLMNPWFFHILVLLSLGFATLSSIFYLNKQGVLSWKGVKRKKKYLSTMYGSTLGINLFLFFLVFPLLANVNTVNAYADPNPNQSQVLGGANGLQLQVNIPCPGHAPLITGELKSIEGVNSVKFDFPNYFDVDYDSRTSKEEILALEVFKTYNATLISENNSSESNNGVESASLSESGSLQEVPANSGDSSLGYSGCGGSCTSCGAAASNQNTVETAAPSCGCGAR